MVLEPRNVIRSVIGMRSQSAPHGHNRASSKQLGGRFAKRNALRFVLRFVGPRETQRPGPILRIGGPRSYASLRSFPRRASLRQLVTVASEKVISVVGLQLVLTWLGVQLLRLWDPDNVDGWEPAAKVRVRQNVSVGGRPIPSLSRDELVEIRRAARPPDVVFFVPGIPAAQGNKQAFRNKFSGKVALVERTAGNPHWRQDVRDAFDRTRQPGQEPLSGPLEVSLRFVFQRPKSHFNSRGELKPTAPLYMTSRPDSDKLQRALLDAIQVPTGGSVINDDALVAQIAATKEYGERPGCFVAVRRLG